MSIERVIVLEQRVSHVGESIERVEATVNSIAETLSSLVRIEERQVAINNKLAEGSVAMSLQDARIKAIELTMPGLSELRKWVIGGVLSGIGMIGAAVVHLVVK